MPRQEAFQVQQRDTHQFKVNAIVYGPFRPSSDLHRQTHRALKAHSAGHDYFTEITLHELHQGGGMRVEYTVTASSPESAWRAGEVYLSQLCDLLSVATRSPVRFYLPEEDAWAERIRVNRQSTTVDRILSETEWSWITGNLVFLRREHSRFLAAASWYRKGLIGSDALDDFCSFWRVIERLASHYADKSSWSEEEKEKSPAKKCVEQLVSDLFHRQAIPAILSDPEQVGSVLKLRNDLSHGKVPITLEVIETASTYLEPLEVAAHAVLQEIKNRKLVIA